MLSLVLAAVTSLFAIVPTTPATVGGWTTYLRPFRYSDVLARGDTVWCTTREAGLLRFSRSQPSVHSITRFPNGLASNELSALTYDRSGRLWVGTYGAGASRMSADGESWSLVNAFDGLPSDSVTCLRAEGDTIWIGTPRGLAFWNGSVIAGSLPVFGQPSPFASDDVNGIVVRGDTLWVATSAGAYYRQRSAGLNFGWTLVSNAGLFPGTQINTFVTNDTLLFCRAANSVYRYDGTGWFRIRGEVFRLCEDQGIVTMATNDGIYRLTNGGQTLLNSEILANNDEANAAIPAPVDADHYVAALPSGLAIQPAPGVTTGWPVATPDGPPGNDLRNLQIDGDRVWVNVFGKGVGRFDGASWRVWSGDDGCSGTCDTTFLSSAFPFALQVDKKGKKWVATWGNAIEEISDQGPSPQFIHHQPSDALGSASHTWMWPSAVDSLNWHYFGGDTPSLGVLAPIGVEVYDSLGAYVGNLSSSQGLLAGNKVHGLTVSVSSPSDRTGQLWVGMTGQGIQTFTLPHPWVTPNLGAANLVPGTNGFDVQGLVARGDTIWALTTHELLRYRRRLPGQLESAVAHYNIPEATPLFAIQPLAVSPDGSPWVGTEAGIRVFHPSGVSEDFNTSNSPVAGNQIYSIRIDAKTGVVWITTSTGMNRYDPAYRPPPPVQVPELQLSIYPNPISLSRMGIQLRLKGNASVYRGSIFDLSGRKVGTFDVPANGRVIWDGRDDAGRMVKPGIYLVKVDAGGHSGTVRVAVLR
jgi:ligand-binding sensor domain-containing protein